MNITELLDQNKSLEERITILNAAYNDDFKELDVLDKNIVFSIEKAINDIIKESNIQIKNIDIYLAEEKKVLNEISQTNIHDLSSSEIKELRDKKKDSMVKVDKLEKNKQKITVNPNLMEKLSEKVNIESDSMIQAKSKVQETINNLKLNVESLTNSVEQYKNFLSKYMINEQEIKETIESLIGQEDTPEKEELFDKKLKELETIEERISKCSTKLDELQKNLGEDIKQLESIEKNREKEEKREAKQIEKEQKVQEKQEDKEERQIESREKLENSLTEFKEICLKEKLSFLDKEKRTSLYHLLVNSKVLTEDEKNQIFAQYAMSVNKTDEEIIGKCSDKLKQQKRIPIISSVRSVIAKGSLITIDIMEKTFDKAKKLYVDYSLKKENKKKVSTENKLKKASNKIERLEEIKAALGAIDSMNNLEQDMKQDTNSMSM